MDPISHAVTGAATYQWYRNGQPLADATGATLDIPQATLANAGEYRVVVTNTHGSTESAVVNVHVTQTAIPGQWGGFPMDTSGWTHTGSFPGLLLAADKWVYLATTRRWIYLPEENLTEEGAWIFWPRQ